MVRAISVFVSSNGSYWQANWRIEYGERFKRSLGPKSELSRRQARKLAQQLENQSNTQTSRVDPREVPTLKQHIERYISSRTDLSAGSIYLHRLTQRYL